MSHCYWRSGVSTPFISARPPKTTGREAFGRQFAYQALEQAQAQNVMPSGLGCYLDSRSQHGQSLTIIADFYSHTIP